MSVKPIPDGYTTITPYLIVEDANKTIEFIEKIFDGSLLFKMQDDAGKINHAEMKIGNAMLMLAEASEEWKPTRTMLYLYVADTDATYKKALETGATSVKEPKDQFYGDRSAGVEDSFGNFWGIATHIEDVSEEEMALRISASAN
ncbi:MAG: VOC family protein [Pyrinomonadaceae bacterium]